MRAVLLAAFYSKEKLEAYLQSVRECGELMNARVEGPAIENQGKLAKRLPVLPDQYYT
jgi:hypothetical protein